MVGYVTQPEATPSPRDSHTLKEQLLWVRHFASIEELRIALLEFKEKYNFLVAS